MERVRATTGTTSAAWTCSERRPAQRRRPHKTARPGRCTARYPPLHDRHRTNRRADGKLTVALVSEVFWEADGAQRLKQTLAEAADRGADLAVLPELPLNPWSPATKEARDDDAEAHGRPAHPSTIRGGKPRRGSGWSAASSIATSEPEAGPAGRSSSTRPARLRATYEKLHLPEEEGFWETSHYEPGTEPPRRIDAYRRSHRCPAVLGQQPARGDACARRSGRGGDGQPARVGGGDAASAGRRSGARTR